MWIDGHNCYDYHMEMLVDILEYIHAHLNPLLENLGADRRAWEEHLLSTLPDADSVTGAKSGYFGNTWDAEEAIVHNFDLLAEVCMKLGDRAGDLIFQGADAVDTAIRRYLLHYMLEVALDTLADDEVLIFKNDEEDCSMEL